MFRFAVISNCWLNLHQNQMSQSIELGQEPGFGGDYIFYWEQSNLADDVLAELDATGHGCFGLEGEVSFA